MVPVEWVINNFLARYTASYWFPYFLMQSILPFYIVKVLFISSQITYISYKLCCMKLLAIHNFVQLELNKLYTV